MGEIKIISMEEYVEKTKIIGDKAQYCEVKINGSYACNGLRDGNLIYLADLALEYCLNNITHRCKEQ